MATRLPGAARGVGFRSAGVRAPTAALADRVGRPVRLLVAAAGWIAFGAGLVVGLGIGLLAGEDGALPSRPETTPGRPADPRAVPRPCSVPARPSALDEDLAFALGYLDDCRFGFASRFPLVTPEAIEATQRDPGTESDSPELSRTGSLITVASA